MSNSDRVYDAAAAILKAGDKLAALARKIGLPETATIDDVTERVELLKALAHAFVVNEAGVLALSRDELADAAAQTLTIQELGNHLIFEISGCAQPLSAERAGAVNAKDNLPATGDGGAPRIGADLTDRQPGYAGIASNGRASDRQSEDAGSTPAPRSDSRRAPEAQPRSAPGAPQ